MAETSAIEWTDATWQPVTGCSVVSPGCTNCYAMRLAGTRLAHHPSRAGLTIDTKAGPVWNGKVRLNEEWLLQPLRWRRPRRIFVCAHGDLFHESVPDEWIDRVFAVMALAPQHTFQVLTKRAKRMREYLATRAGDWQMVWPDANPPGALPVSRSEQRLRIAGHRAHRVVFPLPNVWLGVSAEDQARADERIPDLLATPSAVRFVSCEPLLGRLDLTRVSPNGVQSIDALSGRSITPDYSGWPRLDWIIAGGESGPGARPMHPQWARSLRDQCEEAGVPFFHKQNGEFASVSEVCGVGAHHQFPDGSTVRRVGKARAGRLLDGREHNAMPGAQSG